MLNFRVSYFGFGVEFKFSFFTGLRRGLGFCIFFGFFFEIGRVFGFLVLENILED